MGWNLCFDLQSRSAGEVPKAARRKAARLLQQTFKGLEHLGLVVFEPNDDAPLSGWFQILLRDGCESDFAALLAALQELARDEPTVVVTGSDDFYLEGKDVLAVGPPDKVLNPDETNGTGVYRTHVDDKPSVHRADVLSVDAPSVAAQFLESLTRKGLIEWCGSRESAIGALAGLIESTAAGRWCGAERVLSVLETERAVDIVSACTSIPTYRTIPRTSSSYVALRLALCRTERNPRSANSWSFHCD